MSTLILSSLVNRQVRGYGDGGGASTTGRSRADSRRRLHIGDEVHVRDKNGLLLYTYDHRSRVIDASERLLEDLARPLRWLIGDIGWSQAILLAETIEDGDADIKHDIHGIVITPQTSQDYRCSPCSNRVRMQR
jgi:hypothetical protein